MDAYSVYNEIFSIERNYVQQERIKKLVKTYAELDEALPNILKLYYLINLHGKPTYEFLSKNNYPVSGYHDEDFKSRGPEFFIENLHPDDRDLIVNVLYRDVMKYYAEHPEHRDTLHVEYSYRFKHAEGYYIRVQERFHILEATELGPQLILGEVTRLDDPLDSPVEASYYYVDEQNNRVKVFSSNLSYKQKLDVLTDREKEILKLISAGNTNREIAEVYHISEHTVRTHRNRIWKKLNVKQLQDAIKYAEGLG